MKLRRSRLWGKLSDHHVTHLSTRQLATSGISGEGAKKNMLWECFGLFIGAESGKHENALRS